MSPQEKGHACALQSGSQTQMSNSQARLSPPRVCLSLPFIPYPVNTINRLPEDPSLPVTALGPEKGISPTSASSFSVPKCYQLLHELFSGETGVGAHLPQTRHCDSRTPPCSLMVLLPSLPTPGQSYGPSTDGKREAELTLSPTVQRWHIPASVLH